ncbi:outer membrane protein transport protein [Ruegeria sp. SCSIO 43209]|uniref:OmpP1/FadL family transporter n=1 Tax=Ruegeria sp. SCSIO 43209 TaxID=2793010 RepID=UPI0014809772|nr:outer membrane protein transport protein [Ruegeria sp. SCSIO 43209]UAB90569.1 outer membrane protein transport protein [Ruegeria sp. SCSIO 43209]
MKRVLLHTCALCIGATAAQAGGLDRSGQGVNILFEEGSVVQFRLGYTKPDVSGSMEDQIPTSPTFGETIDSGNVSNSFFTPHLAYKTSLTEKLDFALVYDEPFGADIDYSSDYPLSQNVLALAGLPGATTDVLRAKADTDAITALLRYKLDGGFSVIGGLRAQRLKASVSVPIAGASTTPFASGGYRVETDAEIDFGYVVGVAWERPDIAARVALTYNSKITHDLSQTEANDAITGIVPPGIPVVGRVSADSSTEVVTPQSVNLDFQTGVAPKTLLFGSIRWVDWPQTVYAPPVYTGLTGINLVDYEEATWTYSLGLGYQFSEEFSGAVTLGYESSQGNSVSNLGPTDGFWSIGLGGTYSLEKAKISGGVRYTDIGDATANGTGPDNRATFTGNSAWSVGIQVTYALN